MSGHQIHRHGAGGKSVLWVDDEADLLESHRIFLREKGYEVETATNADGFDSTRLQRPRNIHCGAYPNIN